MVINGSLSFGGFVVFSLLVVRVYFLLMVLMNVWVDVTSALVSVERVFEIIDMPNPITDAPNAPELANVKGALRFDDVTFTYSSASDSTIASLEDTAQRRTPTRGPGKHIGAGITPVTTGPNYAVGDERQVLHGVNLNIEPGQLVAIVGPLGVGKFIFFNLVFCFYDVIGGLIIIDGYDLCLVI